MYVGVEEQKLLQALLSAGDANEQKLLSGVALVSKTVEAPQCLSSYNSGCAMVAIIMLYMVRK